MGANVIGKSEIRSPKFEEKWSVSAFGLQALSGMMQLGCKKDCPALSHRARFSLTLALSLWEREFLYRERRPFIKR